VGYHEESFFVRHAYFLRANCPYKSLKTTLKTEINEEGHVNSDTSRAFDKPKSRRIAVKVINHLGDEVMKVFRGWQTTTKGNWRDPCWCRKTRSCRRFVADESKAEFARIARH
jgi:hypothetical protein